MFFKRFFQRRPSSPAARPACFRPAVELLEGRDVPSSTALAVHAGDSIQAAIHQAAPGATITIDPGIYTEALTVTKANLHLVGKTGPLGEGVVLKNPGDQNNGILVGASAHGFTLTNVTVKNFLRCGVVLSGVDGFSLSHVKAHHDGKAGVFVLGSANGSIDHTEADGNSIAGISVNQSHNISVVACTVHDNVIGIEAENAFNVIISANESYHNTAGILIDHVANLPVPTFAIQVTSNYVHNNNRQNFAPAGKLAALLPPGTGILVLGVVANQVVLQGNTVVHNNFVEVGFGPAPTVPDLRFVL